MKKELSLLLLIILNAQFATTNSQVLRPIRDDIGFCWDAEEINSFMKYLASADENKSTDESKNLVAAISVHDDYLYAGKVYYPLFKNIKTKEVVIFGVTHGSVRKEMGSLSNILILDEFDKWRGPYQDVVISPLREFIKSKLPKDDFIVSNKAHAIEHSIEAMIPFLQYYNRDVKITPIMVTQMPFERMEEISAQLNKIISEYISANHLKIGKDIFFLISNDANHYGEDFNNSPYGMDANAHKAATDNDRRIIKENLIGEINPDRIKKMTVEIWPDSSSKKPVPIWCGRYPLTFGLLTITKILNDAGLGDPEGKLFKYSDTFSEKVLPFKESSMGLTAVFSYRHWCGWFSGGFYSK
ncbi:MAG: AmmeMemoRadiSam system protein B [Ignavibacteriae bacterium HGW-Ignavibacteriae-3]|nr:MAG: AmmeMemoRadiSam system protein B [Ignavibacteriae bacterium HGW-Ignavibacteriae-3]